MTLTLVTFIVPFFNKERFAAAVMQAIDRQEGPFDREIIAIDDGSSDSTPDILGRIAEGRPEVTVLRLADEGPAVAINRAARLARGDYFKFVDGDDLLLPLATAQLVAAIEQTGAGLAFGDCQEYRSESLPDVALARLPGLPLSRMENPLAAILHHPAITMSGALVTAEAFRRVGGCDERVFVHDTPLLLRLAALGPFARLDGAVAAMPTADPSRWSNRARGQVLHDVNAASMYFLLEHPEIAPALRRFAVRRATGRAWKFALRHGGATVFSPYYLMWLASYLPLPLASARLIGKSCGAFRAAADIRIPPGGV
jgi:glycosyltransferase involved in cell wall biosynthesis